MSSQFLVGGLRGSCALAVSLLRTVNRRYPRSGVVRPHTLTNVNLGKSLVDLATAPVRVGLAATEAGLDVANGALGLVKRGLGEAGEQSSSNTVVHLLGLNDTVARANRMAKLADDLLAEDAPLTRALAPDGPIDRLMRPGGLIDRVTAPGGMLDKLTAEGGGLERALAPGGLVDQLLDEDGLVERLLAEDGLADRLLAQGGVIEKLTARNGPLQQLADVADTLNRLTPGLEALAPTIETLREAVITLSAVVNPLSNIADRIPLPGRSRTRRPTPRPVSSQRVIDHED